MSLSRTLIVIAGLDPAIHPYKTTLFTMDTRVEPAHDGGVDANRHAADGAK